MSRSKRRFLPVISALSVAVFTAETELRAQVLPPPPASRTAVPAELFVREYEFEGNTVFSSAELANVTAPFVGRTLSADELEDARRAVTLYYVNHGYVNSGAVLPDQDPSGGIIKIHVIEGKLTRIDVHGNRWLRDAFIQSQL